MSKKKVTKANNTPYKILLPNGKFHYECDDTGCQICEQAFREAVMKAIERGVRVDRIKKA